MSADGGVIVGRAWHRRATHTCAQPGDWMAGGWHGYGSIWRCDCGQHWGLGSDLVWRPMTERKAQRAIQRAARTISTTTTTEHT